jgi:thymidylate synthase (FAD)
MEVKLIASTVIWSEPDGYQFHPWSTVAQDADELAEMAGRLCYKSWDRPNPGTATNAGYLANIIDHQHFSVLEHASASFYIAGVSRSLTHELVRHRHLSFSQVSQRYVDEYRSNWILPPALKDHPGFSEAGLEEALIRHMADSQQLYQEIYDLAVQHGSSKKEARGAARSVLPNMTETSLIVTGNMRSWREVIQKRNSPAADAEIRQLAGALLEHLLVIAPNTFQDMKEEK